MGGPIRSFARRVANRAAAPYVAELGDRQAELNGRIEALERSIDALGLALRKSAAAAADAAAERDAGLDRKVEALGTELAAAREMLHHVYEQPAEQRRRLYALRDSEEYELAFTESEPLVSFVIPTYSRFESLRDVSLPSVLAQSYANLEVIVAGDCAPPETEQVIAELDDPRVRFHNRSVRGPYPDDPAVRWYMIGTPPFNDGLALARGRWIAALGDDDAVRPDHVETLLRTAQERRYECCYGRHKVHYPSGEVLEVGVFPPEKGEFVLQTALYHAGLDFFQMEPADYLQAEPNDWSLCRRMLTAGVRFGMVPEFLADKYESRYHSHGDWAEHGIPSVD